MSPLQAVRGKGARALRPVWVYLGGPAGSGKTEIAGILAEDHGFHRFSLGDLCRVECRQRGWPEDRVHLQAAGDARRGSNPARLAAIACWKLLAVPGPVVVEGVRLFAEAAYLAQRGVIGIAVDAPAAVRAQRLRARDHYVGTLDHQTEREASDLWADLAINNAGSDRAALAQEVRITVARAILLHAERETRPSRRPTRDAVSLER